MNLFQDYCDKCWTKRQNVENITSESKISSERKLFDCLPTRKWFGVNGSGPSVSEGLLVGALEFMEASTSAINVWKDSLLSVRDSINLNKKFSNIWAKCSKLPPKCGAAGRLNFQSIIILKAWRVSFKSLLFAKLTMQNRRTLSALTNDVIFLETNSLGFFRRLTNVECTVDEMSAEKSAVSSRWTALTTRQKKYNTSRFPLLVLKYRERSDEIYSCPHEGKMVFWWQTFFRKIWQQRWVYFLYHASTRQTLSHIIFNSSSRLKYPVVFEEKTRCLFSSDKRIRCMYELDEKLPQYHWVHSTR